MKLTCDSCFRYFWVVYHGTLNEEIGTYCKGCVDELEAELGLRGSGGVGFGSYHAKDSSGEKS